MKVKPMNADSYIPPFPASETAFLSVKEETALIDRIRLPIDIDTFNPNACCIAVLSSVHTYPLAGMGKLLAPIASATGTSTVPLFRKALSSTNSVKMPAASTPII